MSTFAELTMEELYDVLVRGKKPKGGYTIEDYVSEWYERNQVSELGNINNKGV